MATDINLTKSGMGIDEATIHRWLKSEGESVVEGEPLVEVENAKAIEEIAAPVSGTLSRILVKEGETVLVNTTLGTID